MVAKLQRIQRNGLLTIPKEIREKAHINEGDYVETELKPDGIFIKFVQVEKTYRELQTV